MSTSRHQLSLTAVARLSPLPHTDTKFRLYFRDDRDCGVDSRDQLVPARQKTLSRSKNRASRVELDGASSQSARESEDESVG